MGRWKNKRSPKGIWLPPTSDFQLRPSPGNPLNVRLLLPILSLSLISPCIFDDIVGSRSPPLDVFFSGLRILPSHP